ncbi:hypothetical protein AB4F11_00065 [Francisella philomiragia]
MKKTTLLVLAFVATALISCTNSDGDSFGYVVPPPTDQTLDSNEPGHLNQPGGVITGIRSEQGSQDDSFITIKE